MAEAVKFAALLHAMQLLAFAYLSGRFGWKSPPCDFGASHKKRKDEKTAHLVFEAKK